MAHFKFKRSPDHAALLDLDSKEVIDMSAEALLNTPGSLGTAAAIRSAFIAHIISTRATIHDLKNIIKTLQQRVANIEMSRTRFKP